MPDLHLDIHGLGCLHDHPTARAPTLIRIGEAMGFCPVALEKATREEPPEDFADPTLRALVRLARADWAAWASSLLGELDRQVRDGTLYPLTPTAEQRLRDLLGEHSAALVARFTGAPDLPPREADRLVAAGLVRPAQLRGASLIESALRIGSAAPVDLPAGEEPPARLPLDATPAAVERAATARPLTPSERAAADYARRSAAAYLRAAAGEMGARVRQSLAAAEYARVQAQIGEAIENRAATLSALRSRLRADIEDVANVDIDRVVRTEVASAYNAGQAVALASAAEAAGIVDPQVYRLASPAACADCRRLLGTAASPVLYRLRDLRAWDAQGGNVGVPRASWRAGTGPIHPNCGCSGPILWRESIGDRVAAAVERIASR